MTILRKRLKKLGLISAIVAGILVTVTIAMGWFYMLMVALLYRNGVMI